jgi:hypothetical protein
MIELNGEPKLPMLEPDCPVAASIHVCAGFIVGGDPSAPHPNGSGEWVVPIRATIRDSSRVVGQPEFIQLRRRD